MGAGSPRTKHLQIGCLVRSLFFPRFPSSSHSRESTNFGSSSACQVDNPIMGALPSWPQVILITSPRPHLQKPASWRLGLQHFEEGGFTDTQSIAERKVVLVIFPLYPPHLGNLYWDNVRAVNRHGLGKRGTP